jgi:hypothetical protein
LIAEITVLVFACGHHCAVLVASCEKLKLQLGVSGGAVEGKCGCEGATTGEMRL